MSKILTMREAARCIKPGETEAEFIYRHAFFYLASSGCSLEETTEYAEYAEGSITQRPELFAYWNHSVEYEKWARAGGAWSRRS